MDFVFDALSTGRRIKCLTVVDDFTKESVGILVEHGISGFRVTRALDEMARLRGYPKAIRPPPSSPARRLISGPIGVILS